MPIGVPLTSTTSRLPPPRSPATPSGSWMPEMTPSAVSRASSAPRQHVDRNAGDRLDRRDEFRAVRRLARRRRREHMQFLDSDLVGERLEAADRGQRRGDRLRVEPAARRDAAREAAELLLVEERRRRARQPLIDDEPDRVRADVDDGDRPWPLSRPGRPDLTIFSARRPVRLLMSSAGPSDVSDLQCLP